ncbi:MAG: FAD-binding protein [Acidobacteria bacterium]|nr:FAD-binding protein [Acidobacteriota bacterium]
MNKVFSGGTRQKGSDPAVLIPRMAQASELEFELKKAVRGEVRFDAYSRTLYSTDASIYRVEPLGVVIPRDRDDVIAALDVARRHQAPVLPRGGGTSLAGQAIGRAVIFDFSKYMNRVLEVNPGQRRVRVQPGVVLDELNEHLRPHGLFFPPDPASASRCSIGGMIGNNSSGARSIVYGKTVDYLHSLRLALSGGEEIYTKSLSPEELAAKRKGQGRENRIYEQLLRLAGENREEIDKRFPKILRRVGGYNLDACLEPDHINLSRLIAGSEGTLGVVTEAEITLADRPRAAVLLVAHFRELAEALEATQVLLETGPTAVELIDKMILDMTRGTQEYRRRMTFVEGDPAALLVVEYTGENPDELAARLDQAEAKLRRAGMGYAFLKAVDAALQANIWKVRKAGQGLLIGMAGDRKPISFVEDTAVAPEKLPAYIARFREIVREHGTTAAIYAHASVGCLHIRPLIDLKQPSEVRKMRSLAEAVSGLVLEFGGALSGEHGDGMVRSPFNEKMFGTQLYEAFRQVKRAFDPEGLMNPGKIVDAAPMTENLRTTPAPPYEVGQTRFDYSSQGGFAGAVQMCSGVGACRQRGEGTMCPSYRVTGEEEHSTRGRAVLLQAALDGRLPAEELSSTRMFEALDLCLECKGCKGECPANVDMAKLKYEFLARYYQRHPVPLRVRLFAEVSRLNEQASRIAPLYNWAIGNGLVRRVMERMAGIDRRRPLPALARQRFSRWFDERKGASGKGRPEVGLFVDTFTEFHYPEVGQAATRVLEAFGYQVRRLATVCCGRPLISKGLLDRALENVRANLQVLGKAADEGIPVIGLEPSCLLTFRDEYLDMVPGPETQRIAKNTFLLEEFLDPGSQHQHPNTAWSFQPLRQQGLFHGHCHLKALVGSEPSLRLLRSIPGFEVQEVDSGCCGMAGAFGFEKEHYDFSLAVAETKLLPAVRALAPDAMVVASGVSCRQQILHTTGRQPLHPAEVCERALGSS